MSERRAPIIACLRRRGSRTSRLPVPLSFLMMMRGCSLSEYPATSGFIVVPRAGPPFEAALKARFSSHLETATTSVQ